MVSERCKSVTPKERLYQRLLQVESTLETAELDLEELRIEEAKTQLNSAVLVVKELLGSSRTCNCLALPFPHKRGAICPESLT